MSAPLVAVVLCVVVVVVVVGHWAAVVVLSVNEAIGQCNCGGSGSRYMQLQ